MVRQCEHPVARYELSHIITDSLHNAGKIASQNLRKLHWHICLDRAGPDLPVDRLTLAADTFTKTSFGPATSSATSSHFRFSGPPYSCSTIAFIAFSSQVKDAGIVLPYSYP